MEGGLWERDEELAAVDAVVAAAVSGAGGGLVVIEGPAGIGKSSLVDLARRRAAAAGATVLFARGGELEVDFAFGVVRQLFERVVHRAAEEDRVRWMAAAASPTAALFAGDDRRAPASPDATYRLLHGLYWLTVNLSDDAPLAVVVDDAHGADEPSVRYLAFLAARLDNLPVALVVACRPGRGDLDALAQHPLARVCRPRPLGPDAVARWVDAELGPAEEAFARACGEATAGNPLLLRELLREARAEGVAPDAANADAVGALSPRGVAASVALRLAALPADAAALARSVAVLEVADPADAADLAGLDVERAGEGAETLRQADLLAPGPDLAFVHPLVRTAVYGDIPAARRLDLHGRAATRLARSGAGAERVAAHLLLADLRDPWTIGVLRGAAADALAVGSAVAAAGYLRRAADSATGPARADVLVELGRALLAAGSPEAEAALVDAAALAGDDGRHVDAVVGLSQHLRYTGRGAEAVSLLARAEARIDPGRADLRERLDTERLGCGTLSASARIELRPWRDAALDDPGRYPSDAWQHVRLANLALDGALDGRPASVIADLAARAVAGAGGIADERVRSQVLSQVGLACLVSDHFELAAGLLDQLVDESARRSLGAAHAGVLAQRASLHLRVGRLDLAAGEATRALELGEEAGAMRALLPRAASVLVSVAAEQGSSPPVRFLTDDIDPDSIAFRLLAHSRGELLLAAGRFAPAAAALLAYGERNRQLGWNGVATAWRSQAALALARLGRLGEANDLLDEEFELARRVGAPRAVGVALRSAGVVASGRTGDRLLAEAVEVLEGSPARLESGWALALLGVACHRRGADVDARHHLRRAYELALAGHATRLAALSATELRAAGGRPRRTALSGPESLTSSEREVVRLAVDGRSNREIAQSLFVTEKTVETHLGHAYRKLGVAGRTELPRP